MSYYGRLNTGLQTDAAISPMGEMDQYRTALIQGLTYTFTAAGASSGNGTLSDPHMSLTTIGGQQIAYSDDVSSSNFDSQITWTATSTADYFINVAENGNNAVGTYKFQISPGYASNYNDRVAGTGWGDAIAGMDGNDLIAGGGGNDYLYGQNGNDTLQGGADADYLNGGAGNDVLRGGGQNDVLVGGTGADQLIGGTYSDRFVFTSVNDSTPAVWDAILPGDGAYAFEGIGVNGGDVIDLSQIDANPYQAGNQAFVFSQTMGVGTVQLYNDAQGNTVLVGSVDADADPEFLLKIADGNIVAGQYALSDFIL